MSEIRFEVDDEQREYLSDIKEKRGFAWKGLMLAGADKIAEEKELEVPDFRQYPGVTYDDNKDDRVFPRPRDDRLESFKAGWAKAIEGGNIQPSTLRNLSWHNLGWRMGMLFGETSGELKRELYMWCTDHQLETAEEPPNIDGVNSPTPSLTTVKMSNTITETDAERLIELLYQLRCGDEVKYKASGGGRQGPVNVRVTEVEERDGTYCIFGEWEQGGEYVLFPDGRPSGKKYDPPEACYISGTREASLSNMKLATHGTLQWMRFDSEVMDRSRDY